MRQETRSVLGTHNRRAQLASSAAAGAGVGVPAMADNSPILDVRGRPVSLTRLAERVVFVSHYANQDFTAIAGVEGWSKVVGFAREPWEDWKSSIFAEYAKVIPALASLADVGTLDLGFDTEKIIALKPDVVLLDDYSDILIGEQTKALQRAGIPVFYFDFNAETLEKHLTSLRVIGHVMGVEERAATIASRYERQYSDIMARVAQATGPRKSVYAELAQGGPAEAGWTESNRLWGAMAQRLGAINIANGLVPDYGGPLPSEQLMRADPDLIIFAGSSWLPYCGGVRTGYGADLATTQRTLAAYAARPGYDRLKAVNARDVHAIEHNLCWSICDIAAMQYLGKQLHPQLFADLDPLATLAEFHAKYLPVPFSGTWFARLSS